MRLIDADELKRCFSSEPPSYYSTAYIIGTINEQRPMVRCKDCKRWLRDEGHGSNRECGCGYNGGWWLPEDYCSRGERREKDG